MGQGSKRKQRNPKGGTVLRETEEAGSTGLGANQMKALRTRRRQSPILGLRRVPVPQAKGRKGRQSEGRLT